MQQATQQHTSSFGQPAFSPVSSKAAMGQSLHLSLCSIWRPIVRFERLTDSIQLFCSLLLSLSFANRFFRCTRSHCGALAITASHINHLAPTLCIARCTALCASFHTLTTIESASECRSATTERHCSVDCSGICCGWNAG